MVTALSCAQLFQGFELSRTADGCRESTLAMYRLAFRSLTRTLPTEVLMTVTLITPEHLLAWAAAIRPMATATRDQRIAKIKALFRWARENGYIAENVATVLHRPRKDWQPDPLSPDEVERMLEYSRRGRNRDRNYAIVCLLLDSGIRASELCTLRRADVNVRTGQITITASKAGKSRTVMIGKKTRDALWRWLAIQPEGIPWLFSTENDTPFGRDVLRRLVSNIAKSAGLPGRVYPHRLRHTFAILFLRNHGDPYTLQYMLGHEDMTVTREYVKLAAQDVAETYRSPLDALTP